MYRAEETEICSLPALRLEGDLMSLSVLPEPGAKIYDLIWKPTGRQVLWHNPRILPQRYPVDSNFDNYWCGGWDEGFPTCDACQYNGEQYPNLGELRSIRWTVEKLEGDAEEAIAELGASGPISPVRARKRVTLRGAAVRVSYELANIGYLPIDFIWGSHPALAITADTVLHIPAEVGLVQLSSSPALGSPGQRYAWPILDTPVGSMDMSRIQPAKTAGFCGHYATGLRGGWYGVEFAREELGLVFRFPIEQCPWVWMWLVYGGWRGYYHAIVEPWTSCPVHLADAVRQGTNRRLEPGATFSAEISVTVHAGLEGWRKEIQRTR